MLKYKKKEIKDKFSQVTSRSKLPTDITASNDNGVWQEQPC